LAVTVPAAESVAVVDADAVFATVAPPETVQLTKP
jgi:hypothetical protein